MSASAPSPIDRVRQELDRAIQRNVKGWEFLVSPGKAGGISEKDVVAKRGTMNLYHFLPLVDEVYRTPLLFVMATTNRSYIFDLGPGQSLVEFLLRHGYDVYVIDWTPPSPDEKRLRIEDYVLDFIPHCVALVQDRSGEADVSVIGYCMGGVLSVIYGALHSTGPMRNLACFTTPFDWSQFGQINRWSDPRYFEVDHLVDSLGNIPADLIQTSFDMLRPANRLAGQIRLWDNMWNDEYVRSYRAFDKWVAETLPLPGEYFRQTTKELLFENKLFRSELKIGGQKVDVANIHVPFLHIVAEHDHIVPAAASKPLADRIGSKDKQTIEVKGGHVSVVAGPRAVKRLWPQLDQWLGPRSI